MFERFILKATNANHARNRNERILKANEMHPVVNAIKKNKLKPKNLLEIGCSTGFVLEKINELTKKIIPISKNQSHENYNEIKDNFITSDFDSLIDSKELAKSLDLEEEDFIIENNCNFKEANFMSAHNFEDKDWERTTSGNVTL